MGPLKQVVDEKLGIRRFLKCWVVVRHKPLNFRSDDVWFLMQSVPLLPAIPGEIHA
jgi:hypothetical protein